MYIKCSNSPLFVLITTVDGDRDVTKFYSEQELVTYFRDHISYMGDLESIGYFDLDPSLFDINNLNDVIAFIESGPYDTGWGYMPGCDWELFDGNMDELAYGEM